MYLVIVRHFGGEGAERLNSECDEKSGGPAEAEGHLSLGILYAAYGGDFIL